MIGNIRYELYRKEEDRAKGKIKRIENRNVLIGKTYRKNKLPSFSKKGGQNKITPIF